MKKLTSLFALCLAILTNPCASATTPTQIDTRHAIEFSINGIGPGVDAKAYDELRHIIGKAVAKSVIDKFVIYGYGKEGGISGCVEDKPTTEAPSKALKNLYHRLKSIQPNSETTAYSVNRVDKCLADKPKTVLVAKSDGGLQCENNGTSLEEMQTQLQDIKVYSASKQNDGLIRITLCGIDAGNLNVYEIAETDAGKATALGFALFAPVN